MTDNEPIIINGVDVSGCEFAEETPTTPKCRINGWIHCDGQNCHYKQRQRKAEECEKLKEQLERKEESYLKLFKKSNKYIHDLVDKNAVDLSNLALQLQTEKEKVKKLKEKWTEDLKRLEAVRKLNNIAQFELQAEREKVKELEERNDRNFTEAIFQRKRTDKYKQTLDEVKNIVLSTLDCGEWIGQGDNKMEKILNIIKSVKEQ